MQAIQIHYMDGAVRHAQETSVFQFVQSPVSHLAGQAAETRDLILREEQNVGSGCAERWVEQLCDADCNLCGFRL